MPEPADQLTPPLRTWRPMAAWTAGILLALGLAWFVGAVVVPGWQVHRVLQPYRAREGGLYRDEAQEVVMRLGGKDKAFERIRLYLALPGIEEGQRVKALRTLGFAGNRAAPILVERLRDGDHWTRLTAIFAMFELEAPAEDVFAALEVARKDPDPRIAGAAAEALKKLRGGDAGK